MYGPQKEGEKGMRNGSIVSMRSERSPKRARICALTVRQRCVRRGTIQCKVHDCIRAIEVARRGGRVDPSFVVDAERI